MPKLSDTTLATERCLLLNYALPADVAGALLPDTAQPYLRHDLAAATVAIPMSHALKKDGGQDTARLHPQRAYFFVERLHGDKPKPHLLWFYTASRLAVNMNVGRTAQHAAFSASLQQEGYHTRLSVTVTGQDGGIKAELLTPATWSSSGLFGQEEIAKAFCQDCHGALPAMTNLGLPLQGKTKFTVESCRIEEAEVSAFELLEGARLDSAFMLQRTQLVRSGAHELSIERLRHGLSGLTPAPARSVARPHKPNVAQQTPHT